MIAQQPLPPTTELPLILTIEQTNVILNALGARPFNEVAPLIQRIQAQASHHITMLSSPQPTAESPASPAA